MLRWDHLLICGLIGFAASFGVIVCILRIWRRQQQWSTRTAEFHHRFDRDHLPVPRLGGIALAAAFVGIICLVNSLFGLVPGPLLRVIAGASLAMFGLGLWDDFHPLGAKRKLAGQLLIASAAYFLGLGIHMFKIPLVDSIIDLGLLSWPITVLWLVAMTNLINLIDGTDGLAGSISLMLMLLLAVVGSGTGVVSLVAACMAGALVAFLRYNFPPAKIYLGDGGAYFLGFLVGALTIYNSHKGTVVAALIAPLFVLALPILDTSLALLRRGLNGLPLFRPDRRHLHHRLLQSGMSRRRLLGVAGAFTGIFLGLGLVAFWWRGQHLALLLGASTTIVLLSASQFSFSREWFNVVDILRKSLGARAEIRYALEHSRWLAMEGSRGRSVQGICEDTAFIAHKLGFAQLRIQLADGKQVWRMTRCEGWQKCSDQTQDELESSQQSAGPEVGRGHIFRHQLPGHPLCFLELQTAHLDDEADRQGQSMHSPRMRLSCVSKIEIISEVLAEGWCRSLNDWHKQNDLPVRFHGPEASIGVRPTLSLPILAPDISHKG